jgi:hypothetical protein
VVRIDPGVRAAGEAAALVAQLKRAAERGRDRPAAAADIERVAARVFDDRHHGRIAGEAVDRCKRKECAVLESSRFRASPSTRARARPRSPSARARPRRGGAAPRSGSSRSRCGRRRAGHLGQRRPPLAKGVVDPGGRAPRARATRTFSRAAQRARPIRHESHCAHERQPWVYQPEPASKRRMSSSRRCLPGGELGDLVGEAIDLGGGHWLQRLVGRHAAFRS